jgi:hypothetical protein
LRQKSRNFAGAVKADAVRARISDAAAGMTVPREVGRGWDLRGVVTDLNSMDCHANDQPTLILNW